MENERVILYDQNKALFYEMNEFGGEILNRISQGENDVGKLLLNYKISSGYSMKDIDKFLKKLQKLEIVTITKS